MTHPFYIPPFPVIVITPDAAVAHALDRFAPSPEAHEVEYFRECLREMGHDVMPIVRECGR